MSGETYFENILFQQKEDSIKHFCTNYNILTNIVVNFVALLFRTGETPGFKSRYSNRLSLLIIFVIFLSPSTTLT